MHQWMMIKDLDNEVVPLYFIAGEGRRTYVADLAPDLRHIEAILPNGSPVIIVSNVSPRVQDTQVVPQQHGAATYKAEATIDTCCDHREIRPFNINAYDEAIGIERLPPYSLTVVRFQKVHTATGNGQSR